MQTVNPPTRSRVGEAISSSHTGGEHKPARTAGVVHHLEPMPVNAHFGGLNQEASLALNEFRSMLREVTTGVISPLMLMSTILNTKCSASHSISTSSLLLEKFGSISNLLSKTFTELKHCSDLDDESVILLRAIRELLILVLREPIEEGPVLSTNEALHNYLKFTMAHDRVEAVKLLFLTGKNRLIRDEVHSTGTLNRVAVFPREILRRVIELQAAALIIVHNHPSGDVSPSDEDIDMTTNLRFILQQIGVNLHDHVIVGSTQCYSMRGHGHI